MFGKVVAAASAVLLILVTATTSAVTQRSTLTWPVVAPTRVTARQPDYTATGWTISSPFGWRPDPERSGQWELHEGVDLAGPMFCMGCSAPPLGDVTVAHVGWDQEWGADPLHSGAGVVVDMDLQHPEEAGHSLGGQYALMFAERYPEETAGLVLIDAQHPDTMFRIPEAQAIYRQQLQQANIFVILSHLGIVRLLGMGQADPRLPADAQTALNMAKNTTNFITACQAELQAVPTSRLQLARTSAGAVQYTNNARIAAVFPALVRLGIPRVIGYPAIDPALPDHERAELETQLWTTQLADTFHDEYLVTPTADAQVRATGDLGALPLVVLTATEHGYPPATAAEMDDYWRGLQDELVHLSSNNVQRIVAGATHGSLLTDRDHAQATIAAILQVVTAARTGQPLKP